MFQRKPLAAAISSIAAASAIGVVGSAVPNHAYGAEGVIEEVVVTGSRIRRPDLDAVSPVAIVDEEEFTLVGAGEEDYDHGRILATSPLALGFLGKKVGDKVEIDVPRGKERFEILDIRYDWD